MEASMNVLRDGEGTKFPLSRELREKAIEFLRFCDYDVLVPYDRWRALFNGLDPRADKRARTAILKAGTIILREERKRVVCIRNEGYRVVRPSEQVTVSQSESARARRMMKRALQTVTYVALEKLTPEETATVLLEQARAAVAVAFNARARRMKTLPPAPEIVVPKSKALVEFITKKKAV
jgi:hypothetical protein